MKVYFIRHGQTTSNSAGTHQGWGPIGLSERGFAQAAAAHDYVGCYEFDKYYASDLLRTRQTAEVIFPEKFHAGEIVFDADLREIDTGAFYGRHPEDVYKQFGEEYRKRRFIMDMGPLGVEGSEHIKERVKRFRTRLEADCAEIGKGRIAVVAHGGIIRTFTMLTAGTPEELPAGIMRLEIKNCSVNVFEYTPEQGWMIGALNWRPELIAD